MIQRHLRRAEPASIKDIEICYCTLKVWRHANAFPQKICFRKELLHKDQEPRDRRSPPYHPCAKFLYIYLLNALLSSTCHMISPDCCTYEVLPHCPMIHPAQRYMPLKLPKNGYFSYSNQDSRKGQLRYEDPNMPCFYLFINLNLSVSSTYDIVSQEYSLEGAMLRIQY